MDLFVAAAEHGPGTHGPIGLVVVVVLAVIALGAVLIRTFRFRRRSAKRPDGDRGGGGGEA